MPRHSADPRVDNLSSAFLLELVEEEQQERHSNRIQRWLRESRLPLEKTLDTFDRGRLLLRIDYHLRVLLEGK